MAPRNSKPSTTTPAPTSEDDRLARLRQALADDDGTPPEMWDPEEGESLVADVIRYEERTTKVGPCRVCVVADVDTGELLSVWLSRSVLKNEFEKQSPRVGDTIGLKFHGEKTTRNGQSSYFLYTLRVVRNTAAVPDGLVEHVVSIDAEDDVDVPM